MTEPAEGASVRIPSKSVGLTTAVLSAVSFGTSGAFIKPLLEAGWSPAAAVTARALTAAVLLLPFVLVSLRRRWTLLRRARWRVLGMGVIGVAFTQLMYFAAIQRIPVATALLIEFLAPLLLVGFAWATTRRLPPVAVLIGSVLAVGGLILVIGPGALGAVDPLGLTLAFGAAIGCAAYFVIAARPGDGLPPVVLAGTGLALGGVVLALVGVTGLLPLTATFGDLTLLGSATTPWWVPLLIVAIAGTALAYVLGTTASRMLGSRLASFVGLLEVVFASLFAWLLLGEELTPLQLVGAVLILCGIAAIPGERPAPAGVPESDGQDPTLVVAAPSGRPGPAS
jgi:drug/metabolite transporter (DMT)-like permease